MCCKNKKRYDKCRKKVCNSGYARMKIVDAGGKASCHTCGKCHCICEDNRCR